jgi:hypothetical protein
MEWGKISIRPRSRNGGTNSLFNKKGKRGVLNSKVLYMSLFFPFIQREACQSVV